MPHWVIDFLLVLAAWTMLSILFAAAWSIIATRPHDPAESPPPRPARQSADARRNADPQKRTVRDGDETVDDLRVLGAAYLRAYLRHDVRTVAALSTTASERELLAGMLITTQALALSLATLRGVSVAAIADDFHVSAVRMLSPADPPNDPSRPDAGPGSSA